MVLVKKLEESMSCEVMKGDTSHNTLAIAPYVGAFTTTALIIDI